MKSDAALPSCWIFFPSIYFWRFQSCPIFRHIIGNWAKNENSQVCNLYCRLCVASGSRSLPALAVDPYSTSYFPNCTQTSTQERTCSFSCSRFTKIWVHPFKIWESMSESRWVIHNTVQHGNPGLVCGPRLGSPEWRWVRELVRPACTTTPSSQSKSRLRGDWERGGEPTNICDF